MTPKCCQECRRMDEKGNCVNHKGRDKWRDWFRKEWAKIRRAAALIIERREYRQDKLEEIRKEYEGGQR